MQKAVFLDRDGVLNKDNEYYTFRYENFIINEGVVEALQKFQANDFLLFVITNQSGIAKKMYTANDVFRLHEQVNVHFLKNNINITEYYFCPHHPEISNCICRKPNSLLLEKAIAIYTIDVTKSFFIGDRSRDMEAANHVGVKGILIESNQNMLTIIDQIIN
jgi:D-glycero-D-manno-heptose 1,7-bisphosphate phosphatase